MHPSCLYATWATSSAGLARLCRRPSPWTLTVLQVSCARSSGCLLRHVDWLPLHHHCHCHRAYHCCCCCCHRHPSALIGQPSSVRCGPCSSEQVTARHLRPCRTCRYRSDEEERIGRTGHKRTSCCYSRTIYVPAHTRAKGSPASKLFCLNLPSLLLPSGTDSVRGSDEWRIGWRERERENVGQSWRRGSSVWQRGSSSSRAS